jgi:hypothetical protein
MELCADEDGFARSRAHFEEVIGFLDGGGASGLSHAELEDRLNTDGRELLRLLYQDHLDLRALRERRSATVLDSAGVDRSSVEAGHARTLTTIFGEVTVTRLAYRHLVPGVPGWAFTSHRNGAVLGRAADVDVADPRVV